MLVGLLPLFITYVLRLKCVNGECNDTIMSLLKLFCSYCHYYFTLSGYCCHYYVITATIMSLLPLLCCCRHYYLITATIMLLLPLFFIVVTVMLLLPLISQCCYCSVITATFISLLSLLWYCSRRYMLSLLLLQLLCSFSSYYVTTATVCYHCNYYVITANTYFTTATRMILFAALYILCYYCCH